MSENEMVVQAFIDAINEHDIEAIAKQLSDDVKVVYSSLRVLNKEEYLNDFVHEFEALESKLRIDTFISKGNIVVLEWYWWGVHMKDYHGRPATGKTLEAPGVFLFVLKGKKIKLIKYYWTPSLVFD
jgi:steroid delta-isomerase-like uncharacterized protein